MGVPEGDECERRVQNLFKEIMAENFLNLLKEKGTQVQEEQRMPIKMNKETYTKTHHN